MTIKIAVADLQQFSSTLLQAADVPKSEADIVAENLVSSNQRGHDSHGVVRLTEYVEQLRTGELVTGVELVTVSESPSILATDAKFGFGMVQAVKLIDRLLPKGREQGIACGTMQNCGHVGRLGEWVERVAKAGLAGLMAVNDNGVLQCVAPPGGTQPRISTNPIAIAVPTGNQPLVLDISTSAVANGKLLIKHKADEPCPPGWLLDANGNPTTDPAVRFRDPRGTILPMGGEQSYKGFGIGLLFDVLVGGLSGGFCPPAKKSASLTNNVLFVIWNPERFVGSRHFLGEADRLIEYVRSVRCKPGVDKIRLSGDRSSQTMQQRLAEGIPLDKGTWKALVDLADELSVDFPVITGS